MDFEEEPEQPEQEEREQEERPGDFLNNERYFNGKLLYQIVMDEVKNLKLDREIRPSQDAIKLLGEYLYVFVAEAVLRAEKQADLNGTKTIDASHIQRILPQLLLDF